MKITLVLCCFIICGFFADGQVCNYPAIDSNANVGYTCKNNLQINGKIDDTSLVKLTSMDGNVLVTGKIDFGSNVAITAKRGSVSIGQKIDGHAVIKIVSREDIVIEGKIDGGAQCDFYSERGKIIVKDKVGNNGTVIRYHSVYPPVFQKGIDITPVAY